VYRVTLSKSNGNRLHFFESHGKTKFNKGEIMAISKVSLKETLNTISSFSKEKEEICSNKEKAEARYNQLVTNLMEFKKKLRAPKTMKGEASLEIDPKMQKKIEKALNFFETKEKEEKTRVLQGTLFWEQLFGFQKLLEIIQDEPLGRKVEETHKSKEKNR